MSLPFYELPDGPVQVSFSGGRTSAYMLRRLLDANPEAMRDEIRVQVIFANTGREMPETLDFVAEVGRRWGVPITWLEWRPGEPGQRYGVVGRQGASECGEPFEALVDWKGMLPNRMARFCTSELKIRPARDYLRSLGWEHWTSAVGIRADEPRRWKKNPDAKERWTRWMPLVPAGVSKQDVAAFWQAQDFDLELANIEGRTPLGNCDGCFLKSERSLTALAREHPERHAWWEAMEARIPPTKGRELRWRPEYTRAELRNFVERQGDWIFDADNDALCAAEDGECME